MVHCAAAVDDWAPLAEQRPATVAGTVAALATWPAARFVHVSSASVYPPYRRGVVREHDGPDDGLSAPYARAKAEAEGVVAGAATAGRDALVLRPHAVYGPRRPDAAAAAARRRAGGRRPPGAGGARAGRTPGCT